MELDDLKGAWAQYDKKLTVNLKLNEELLRKMNLNNSQKEMQKPLILELIGIFIGFLFSIYILVSSIRFIEEPKYCIPGFISLTVLVVYLIFGIYRANRFMEIDYYGSSVLKLQKDIVLLKKLVLKLRKYELLLIPILAIPLFPLLFKAIHNIDIYKNIKLLTIEIVVSMIGGYSLTLWINKYLIDKKFKNTENLLIELEKFEKEE